MKKKLLLPLILFETALAVVSCSTTTTKKTFNINLSSTKCTLDTIGQQGSVKISNYEDEPKLALGMNWTIKDTSIVNEVSKTKDSFYFKAVGYGTTTLTVTSKYNPACFSTCTINVGHDVTSIDTGDFIDGCNVLIGQPRTINAKALPESAYDKTLTFTTGDTSVATVTNDGVINGLSNGQTTITIASKAKPSIKKIVSFNVISSPITPTSFDFVTSSYELIPGGSTQLEIKFTPEDAKYGNKVSFQSSDTNVATVDDNGVVTVLSSASYGSSCDITASLPEYPSIPSKKANIKVKNQQKYTVMIYLCGSNLESGSGLASTDIGEMLEAKGQNKDVNVVIETGGSTTWKKYDISNKHNSRYHISNNTLIKDMDLDQNYKMGDESTLESFLTWSMNNYPAEKMSLILWDHGGGMQGVCYDEIADSKSFTNRLYNSEVQTAIKNSIEATKVVDKLEWIGYDACLMSVQDVASFNSKYCNYMISSQESEPGYGWPYTNWLSTLFNKPEIDTPSLLKVITDDYIKEMHDYYEEATTLGYDMDDNATLSVLDLSKMNDYRTSFESVASKLETTITSSSKWNTFANVAGKCYDFGIVDGQKTFGLFDVKKLLTTLPSTYSDVSSECTTALSKLNDLVIYNKYNTYYTSSTVLPCGLSFFCPISGHSYTSKEEYSSSETDFSTYQKLVSKYGYFPG